jgi:8-oxo-dGTP pyrophosphatase MutT (NUDIX family)
MLSLIWRVKNILLSLLKRKTVGARALLIRDDMVLLVKHSYIKGWHTAGGGVDAGESGMQALIRELREEVGVTLESPPDILGFYHNSNEGRDDYIIMYVATDFTIVPATSLEITMLSWFPLDTLPDDISPATKRRIEEYLGTRPLSDLW